MEPLCTPDRSEAIRVHGQRPWFCDVITMKSSSVALLRLVDNSWRFTPLSEQPFTELRILVRHSSNAMPLVGIYGELDMPAGLPHSINHCSARIKWHCFVVPTVKRPDRHILQVIRLLHVTPPLTGAIAAKRVGS